MAAEKWILKWKRTSFSSWQRIPSTSQWQQKPGASGKDRRRGCFLHKETQFVSKSCPRGMFPAKHHSLKPSRLLLKKPHERGANVNPSGPLGGAQTSSSCSSSVEKGEPPKTHPPTPRAGCGAEVRAACGQEGRKDRDRHTSSPLPPQRSLWSGGRNGAGTSGA